MKPEIIADFSDHEFHAPVFPFALAEPGAIYTKPPEAAGPDFPLLVSAASDKGYALRKPKRCSSMDLLYVKRSLNWHRDPLVGLQAITLLASNEPEPEEYPQLITKHGALIMRVGQMAVFDTRQGHAWIANGSNTLAGITVKKVRRR